MEKKEVCSELRESAADGERQKGMGQLDEQW